MTVFAVHIRETKRYVSQIPCEIQRSFDILRSDYTQERNELERDHSFGVWRHSATKKKVALGRIVVAFCRHPRIAHCIA